MFRLVALLIPVFFIVCASPRATAQQLTINYTASERNLWIAWQAYHQLDTCHQSRLVDRREFDEWTGLFNTMMADGAAQNPPPNPAWSVAMQGRELSNANAFWCGRARLQMTVAWWRHFPEKCLSPGACLNKSAILDDLEDLYLSQPPGATEMAVNGRICELHAQGKFPIAAPLQQCLQVSSEPAGRTLTSRPPVRTTRPR